MILDNDEVEARLSSPLNLLNRLNSLSKPKVVSIPEVVDSSIDETPSVTDLVDNLENKITGGRAYTNALGVLSDSVSMLRGRLSEVESPKELSRIASDMSKIVNGFNEKNNKGGNSNTVIVYKPVVNQESHYETIYAQE